jgi:hypothetical protein
MLAAAFLAVTARAERERDQKGAAADESGSLLRCPATRSGGSGRS